MQLRHDLHVLDAVCALGRPDPRALRNYPLSAWATPAMSARFIDGVIPDALLALQLATGSAVLTLEVDEGTEHAPVIRAKLARYAEALDGADDWHLLFVVGEAERARWLRRLAGRDRAQAAIGSRAWATTIDGLGRDGPGAQCLSLGPTRRRACWPSAAPTSSDVAGTRSAARRGCV
ncbi:MAG TPA: replication-relaxation family protein [Candidatus Limnocylindria bacterium]|nr:replication-relaxation family protein [Candidatus Limnocylindria bacterium]